MPRSSRHKSHKQSKHSSRDARDYSDSEEDVKMKGRNGKEEGSVRVSRDSGSSEKRKLSSGKDQSGHGNGDTSEEYVASKRRKEKADVSGASDRWNGGGDERGDGATVEKEVKGESSRIDADKRSKSAALVDSKIKSSRRHDSGSEKKEENVGLAAEKEESKSSSRVDSKRKSEKDSGRKEVQQYKDSKESKDKEHGLERERKIQDNKRETEARAVDGEASRKQGPHSVDFGEDRQGKRGRENTELPIQAELRNPELEKELEKRTRRRRDGSNDRDKHHDDVKESEDRRLSSRGERAKDGRYKDEKHKDGSSGDKHREDGDGDNRNRDDKYREDAQRESRHRDVKYREDGERDNRHRDDKYREDGERGNRHRDDKYREDSDRDNRHKDDKYREDGDRDNRHRGDKYCEDGDRDDRHRDDRYLEDGSRDGRNRDEISWGEVGRDSRHRDGKQRVDSDKDKRLRDVKYWDERSSRDRTGDKSDIKRSRDESNAVEEHYRKSNNHDGSPVYEDRSSRYKDDKGRRRTSDKEDHSDIRSRSTKEQHSDAPKKAMSSARVESVSDRGRSNARNADVDVIPNHSRRRISPSSSSHTAKDHYRLSKQEESKYRDYAYEERIRHDVTSSKEFSDVVGVTEKPSLSRSIDKSLQKDDNHLGELSAERRLKADARTSPLQMMDKSQSSMSTDRRHLNRPDVRRSLDIEDSGQKSGGSKDARDYSGREGRGSRELPMETLPGDEFSQADGDNLSISSPFSRGSHFSSNSRSLLPPTPFRMGPDGPLVLGSLEDDNRGKSNFRHRRIGDPNMGRVQGNAWRGVPNWPSPVANGFLPFQHGPPSVGFHPVMQQFPAPPMFGVRPSMELNQSGVPYHVPDSERFSGHGRPLGWRNPVDDSCPPPIHGWDGNNSVFGDESHMYGRPNWNHSRNRTSGRVWDINGDTWKGQNSGVSMELPQKEDYSARGSADEIWAGQSVLQAQNDKKQSIVPAESIDIDQSSDACERNTLGASKTIPEEMPNLSREDEAPLSHFYLSMLDISADLTEPELYSQYTSLMGMDQNTNHDEDDSKFLVVEEAMDATVRISNETSSASLFTTINDSVFQKAISLYKKLREDDRAINGDRVPFSNVENLEPAPTLNNEGAGLNDDKPGEVAPACGQQEAEGAVSALNKMEMEVSPAITYEKIDEPVLADSPEKSEESIAVLNPLKMELDSVSKQETLDFVVEDKSSYPENVERSDANSPGKVEEVSRASSSKEDHSATEEGQKKYDADSPGRVEEVSRASDSKEDHFAAKDEGQKLYDVKCGPLLFSDVSSEAVMPESIESGSVNLSRIHQSPESTH